MKIKDLLEESNDEKDEVETKILQVKTIFSEKGAHTAQGNPTLTKMVKLGKAISANVGDGYSAIQKPFEELTKLIQDFTGCNNKKASNLIYRELIGD